MTHVSRAGFAVRRLALSAAFLGLLSLAGSPAFAGKPSGGGGGSTGPTGTIYYRVSQSSPTASAYYAIKPDGTGQASDILPNIDALTVPSIPDANPAYSPSGVNVTHDRWWICAKTTGVYSEWHNPDGG